jgi:hypothetical protein
MCVRIPSVLSDLDCYLSAGLGAGLGVHVLGTGQPVHCHTLHVHCHTSTWMPVWLQQLHTSCAAVRVARQCSWSCQWRSRIESCVSCCRWLLPLQPSPLPLISVASQASRTCCVHHRPLFLTWCIPADALLLARCTTAPLHHCSTAPLHHCITAPLHRCNTALTHQLGSPGLLDPD